MEKLGRVADKSQTVEKWHQWPKSAGKCVAAEKCEILDTNEKRRKTSSWRQARYTWYWWKARENKQLATGAVYLILMKSAGKQVVGDKRGILDTDEKRGKTSSWRQARYTWYRWKARENKQLATSAVYLIPMQSAENLKRVKSAGKYMHSINATTRFKELWLVEKLVFSDWLI